MHYSLDAKATCYPSRGVNLSNGYDELVGHVAANGVFAPQRDAIWVTGTAQLLLCSALSIPFGEIHCVYTLFNSRDFSLGAQTYAQRLPETFGSPFAHFTFFNEELPRPWQVVIRNRGKHVVLYVVIHIRVEES